MKRKHNFAILLASQILSKLSDRMILVGLSWYILQVSSKQMLAEFLVVSMLPHFFMIFFSGKIINRFSPISIMKAMELSRSLVFLFLFVLFFLKSQSVIVITMLIMLSNLCASLFNPALLTVPKQLKFKPDQFKRICALLNTTAAIAMMIGPILVAPIYMTGGVELLISLAFFLYLMAWIFELFIENIPWEIFRESSDHVKRFSRYSIFLNDNRLIIRLLCLFFIINLAFIPLQLLIPILVKDHYHLTIHFLAMLEFYFGLGLVLGGLLISTFPFSMKPWLYMSIPYFIASIAYLFLGLTTISFGAIVAIFCFGFFLSVGNVQALSFYQIYPQEKNAATIMSLVNFISNASGPAALFIAGLLISVLNVQDLIILYALISMGIIFFLPFSRELRQVRI